MFTIRVEGIILHTGHFVEESLAEFRRRISDDKYGEDFSQGLGPLTFPREKWEFELLRVSIDDVELFDLRAPGGSGDLDVAIKQMVGEKTIDASHEEGRVDGVEVNIEANEGFYDRETELEGEFDLTKLCYIYDGDRCVGMEYNGVGIADLSNDYTDMDGYEVELSYYDSITKESGTELIEFPSR